MRSVRDVFGVSAVFLIRYGVIPNDNVYTAIKVLDKTAPHLAKLLKSVLHGDGGVLAGTPPGGEVVFNPKQVEDASRKGGD